jgi:hypothetical protein
MAKFLILIYGDAQEWEAMTAAERAELEAGPRDVRRGRRVPDPGRARAGVRADGDHSAR